MMFVRILATTLGLLMMAAGIFVVLQGTGVLRWPADSVMVADRAWAVRGAVFAMVGGIVVWLARRC
ncbi:hypothetical protein QUC32_16325 [Novosphingobium resinovorum]|uniref:Uncharacterized protein n=1 Tax=Novosphingobium resinovorum TaxID=158500 RepID=A0A031K4L1_9SPHN|nr:MULTISPECIES: hypothetical protein [Sphingomonadaceae]AOR75865.1 hypothetical protein BES08_03195 [Novosphingobium resinovorum]EJU09536.1 hypothetical protein LH128_28418 [Sphingomonas sp. LH128]EZP84866.1 hypothetical protein BV97_00628 [Novosphingobium resinovorum]MBF7011232.1 hypothetical protein [Novosphingobium sp. HR1a]WJM29216.1 hypothetical protein QUC32_16325 [Novosphingobium resinovorum]